MITIGGQEKHQTQAQRPLLAQLLQMSTPAVADVNCLVELLGKGAVLVLLMTCLLQ